MKIASKLALATALASVVGMLPAAPALAKKKEVAADVAPQLSEAVRAPAFAAQTALSASPKDFVTAEPSVAAAEAAAKTDYERYVAQSLRLSLENGKNQAKVEAQRNDYALAAPLDALIANPATPATELPLRLNERGNVAYNLKKYQDATQFFTRARDLGFTNQDLLLNIARSRVEGGDVTGGMASLDAAVKAEIAAGRKPPESWYKYAIPRLYKINADEQVQMWTRMWLAAYGTRENWRNAIYSFGFSGSGAERLTGRNRIDLYRLMRATHSLAGQKEYIDYADASLKTGLPTEAASVIDEGLSSAIIPKGNASATEIARGAKIAIANDKSLAMQERNAIAAPKGDIAGQTGDSYLGARQYAKAVELYRLAESKGVPDVDRNTLHLGIAQALAGDRQGAQATLAKVTGEPNAAIARLWTTWIVTPPST